MTLFYLYRHFDEGGALLYVGVTDSIDRRTKQHLMFSEWKKKIKKISFEIFSDRPSALDAEKKAIWLENPPHNGGSHHSNVVTKAILEGISQGKWAREIAREVGLSHTAVYARINQLDKWGLIPEKVWDRMQDY